MPPADCPGRGRDPGATLGALLVRRTQPRARPRHRAGVRLRAAATPGHALRLAWVASTCPRRAAGRDRAVAFPWLCPGRGTSGDDATLLCCDAWLDVLSSVGQGLTATVVAIGEAAFAELPLAALFAWVALRFPRVVAESRPSLRRRDSRSAIAAWCRRPGMTRPSWTGSREPAPVAAMDTSVPRRAAGAAAAAVVAAGGLYRAYHRLIPWIAWLFATLPQTQLAAHWHLRGRPGPRAGHHPHGQRGRAAPPLADRRGASRGAAALLLKDAWFNVLTARQGHSADALGIAIGLELPLAGMCL